MTSPEIVGINCRRYRRKNGVTQEDVSDGAGVSVTYLRRIEHGTANITINILDQLAAYMHITPKDLLDENLAI